MKIHFESLLNNSKRVFSLFIFLATFQLANAQCNEIYVTTAGAGAGTQASPASLVNALTIASSGDIIKMAIGIYSIDNPIANIPSGVTIEGGFDDGNGWAKTSLAGATTIFRSALNPEGAAGQQRLVAIYGAGSNNFRLQDVTITTANATGSSMSTYGVHLTNCSDYYFTRARVLPGDASGGVDGDDGVGGANGVTGNNGLNGDIDDEGNPGHGGNGNSGGGTGAGAGGAGGFDTNGGGCCQTGSNGTVGSAGTVYRAGGGGGGGGCGGEETYNGGYGGNGGNGGGGAAGGSGAGFGGVGQDPGTGGTNGRNGNAGANGSDGINGTSAYVAGFFIPNSGTSGTDGAGGSGAEAGGGGGGQYCTFCFDGAGNGGGAGGSGGEGGSAGTFATGAGGSFAVYLNNNGANTNFIDCELTAGAAGVTGIGGAASTGGTGGSGGVGASVGIAEIGRGGNGGVGGDGGTGGSGGDGSPGVSLQIYNDAGTAPVNSDISDDLTALPVITWDNEICAYNTATFTSGASGNWAFGASASPASVTGASVETEYTSVGRHTIDFNGNIYTDFVLISPLSPDQANAGSDQNICITTTTGTLAGNNPSTGTGTWTSLGSATVGFPSQFNSTVSGLVLGSNEFEWVIDNGACCPPTKDTVDLFLWAEPTVSNAGIDSTVCGTDIIMYANSPSVGTGLWTLASGGGAIAIPGNPATTITALAAGASEFTWTISNGACPASASTVEITTTTGTVLPSAINISNNNFCTGGSVDIDITGNGGVLTSGGVWTWYAGGCGTGTSIGTGMSVTGLTPASTTTYYVREEGGVCGTTACINVTVTVDQLPTASTAGSDFDVCGATGTLGANSPSTGTGLWTVVSGPGTLDANTANNSGVSNLSVATPSVFQWSITNGSCAASTSQVTVTSFDNPSASNAGTSQNVCATSATLAANTPAVGSGIWTTTAGSGVASSPTDPTSAVTGLSAGTNTFMWTVSNGPCTPTTSTVDVFSDGLATGANAGLDQDICGTAAVALAGNSPTSGTGAWTTVSGPGTVDVPTANNSTVSNLSIATPTVFEWTIVSGSCPPSSSQVTITSFDSPTASNAGTNQNVCAATATLAANTPVIGTGAWTTTAGGGTVTTPSDPASGVTGLTAGTNTFTWTITNGPCAPSSSSVDVIVDVMPTSANAGLDQNVCGTSGVTLAGNGPTSGAGTWTTVSGPGTVDTPGANNSSVSNLTTVVATVFEWTITSGSCPSSSAQVTVTSSDAPSTSNAGLSQTICDATTATLSGNIPVIGTGAWTTLAGGGSVTTPSSGPSGVTGLTIGINTFQWEITNGSCPPDQSSVSITIEESSTDPTSAFAANPFLCVGQSTTLQVSGGSLGTGASWEWHEGSPTGPLLGTGTIVSTPALSANTDYYVIANGNCNSTTPILVSVNVGNGASDPTGATQSVNNICPGDTTTLTVTGAALPPGYTWVWYTGACGAVPVGVGTSLDVMPTSTTIYYVRAVGTCGETNCETVTIDVQNGDVAATGILASQNNFCVGDSALLTLDGGNLVDGNWMWYENSCGGNLIATTTVPELWVYPSNSTAYYARAEGGTCGTTACADILLNVLDADAYLVPFDTLCGLGAPFNLTGGLPLGGLYSGIGINAGIFDPSVAGVGTHAVTYTFASANGCIASTLENIVIENGTLSASHTVSTASCADGGVTASVVVIGGNGIYSYTWSDGSNSNPYTYIPEGTYSVSVSDGSGCATTITGIEITSDMECIEMPNSFTPNGDGVNDDWNVDLMNYSKVSMQVFSKWGKIVFETNDKMISWDGMFEGSPLPANTYYYILKLDGGQAQNGPITIVR